MGFPGTFARLKSRLSYMAGNQVRYGPNGPGNQAPGRSASILTRTASRGRYSINSDPPVRPRASTQGLEQGRAGPKPRCFSHEPGATRAGPVARFRSTREAPGRAG
jgi:hypothetical protein